MTNAFPAIGSFAMRQDLAKSRRKFGNARIANVASLCLADDLTNVADVCGHDREIARHGLLDDIWGTFLIGWENEGVASAHVKREVFLRLLGHDQEFDRCIFCRKILGYGFGKGKALDRNLRAGRKEQVL